MKLDNKTIGIFVLLYLSPLIGSFSLYNKFTIDHDITNELQQSKAYIESKRQFNDTTLIKDCDVKNCSLCSKLNKKHCVKCSSGLFLDKANDLYSCESKCKGGNIADTISMKCIENHTVKRKDMSKVYSSILFSSESCRNKCGMQLLTCRYIL